MYEYRARVVRVLDGDTLHLVVDLGFDISCRVSTRLLGVDCPERGTDAGTAATAFTTQWVADNIDGRGDVFVRTVKDRKEKFGRMLATIHPADVTQPTLNNALLDAGHATSYSGGRR